MSSGHGMNRGGSFYLLSRCNQRLLIVVSSFAPPEMRLGSG